MSRRKDTTDRRSPSRWAVAGCLTLAVLGTLVTLGCLLSIYGEGISFGGPPRPTRTGYVAMLSIGAVAGIAIPAAVCAVVLNTPWRLVVVVTAVVTAILGVLILGII